MFVIAIEMERRLSQLMIIHLFTQNRHIVWFIRVWRPLMSTRCYYLYFIALYVDYCLEQFDSPYKIGKLLNRRLACFWTFQEGNNNFKLYSDYLMQSQKLGTKNWSYKSGIRHSVVLYLPQHLNYFYLWTYSKNCFKWTDCLPNSTTKEIKW